MNFHSRIKKLREASGLKQTELAQKLNIPRTTYSNYENARREPDFNTLKILAEFFDCSIDYLLGSRNEKRAYFKNNADNNIVSERIKLRRKSLNMTQNDLALLLNVPKELINDFESGNELPDLNFLVSLSTILRTTSDYLLGISDKPSIEYKLFTDRLKDLMIKEGMTKEKLSNDTSITKSTLEKYINGTLSPEIEALKSLAKSLNTSMDYLVGLNNNQYSKDLELLEGSFVIKENGISKTIPIKDILNNKYNLDSETIRKFLKALKEKNTPDK